MNDLVQFILLISGFWIFTSLLIYLIRKLKPNIISFFQQNNFSFHYYMIRWETKFFNSFIRRFCITWSFFIQKWFSFGVVVVLILQLVTMFYFVPVHIISQFTKGPTQQYIQPIVSSF